MRRFVRLVVVVLVVCTPAWAHDLGVDVTLNGTAPSVNNPRSGSLGFSLSGSYDFTERWSAFLTGVFMRDFATRSEDSFSPGSNVFLFSGGAMFVANDHFMVMATVSGSPPSVQRNATTFEGTDQGPVGYVIKATNFSVGGSLLGSYATNGFSNWEHTFDLSAGVNHLESDQIAELGTTLRARLLRSYCERNPVAGYCPIVLGIDAPLTQVRLGGTYTATLFLKTDVALDVAGFLYDVPDPLAVGSYSAAIAGRQGPDVGLGTPVAPWVLTVRPSVVHRAGSFSVKLTYQYGLYASQSGSNHLVSAKLSWKVNPTLKLSLTALGQTDFANGSVANRGGSLTTGLLILFP